MSLSLPIPNVARRRAARVRRPRGRLRDTLVTWEGFANCGIWEGRSRGDRARRFEDCLPEPALLGEIVGPSDVTVNARRARQSSFAIARNSNQPPGLPAAPRLALCGARPPTRTMSAKNVI